MADVDYALHLGAMQMQNQLAKERTMNGKKGKGKGKHNSTHQAQNNNGKTGGDFKIETTLHGYPMIGPFTPSQKDVWYCDHKECQYTQHGVYRRYKIQNWRSSQFGKKFVLCDGCVRQYQKVQPIVKQQTMGTPNVNVKLNINGGIAAPGAQPGAAPVPYAQQPQYVPRFVNYVFHHFFNLSINTILAHK